MKDCLEFIEKYSIDKRFYCRIKDVYNKSEWEIIWNRSDEGGNWGIKKPSDPKWSYCGKENLYKVLSFNKIDIFQFESEIHAKIKNMIVFSNLMQKEAKKILGNDIVETSLAEYEKFAKSLMETIKELLPETNISDVGSTKDDKPKLKLVSRNLNN